MLKPRRKITVGNNKFITESVVDMEIEEGFNKVGKTARFSIPRYIRSDNHNYIIGDNTRIFQVMDKVVIDAGYDATATEKNLENRFEGFITRIVPGGTFITVYCENEVFLCKQVNKQTSYTGPIELVNLADQLMRDVRDEFSGRGFSFDFDPSAVGSRKAAPYVTGDPFAIVCIDATLSGYRLKRNPNMAQALQGFRTHFGFRPFFRDHVLYIGALWYKDIPAIAPKTHVFKFQHNIIDDGRALEYRRAEDFKMGIKVISVNQDDNSRYEEFVGEEGGDLKTIHLFHRDGASEQKVRNMMQQAGKTELASRNYTGYHGKFKTFGEPLVRHGDNVRIIDPRYGLNRDGTYKVEGVRFIDGKSGQYQEITLHARIDTDDNNILVV